MLRWRYDPQSGFHTLSSSHLELDEGPYGIYKEEQVGCVLVVQAEQGTVEHWILFPEFSSPTLTARGTSDFDLTIRAIRPSECAKALAAFDDGAVSMQVADFLSAMKRRAKEEGRAFTYLKAEVSRAGVF